MSRLIILISVSLALGVGAYLLLQGRPQVESKVQAESRSPPEVGVVSVTTAEVPLPIEYAGRIVAFREVEVRSLVGGILLKRGFDEGAQVTQGQALFQIDPAPYKVALSRAEAQLAQAQATLRQAEDNFGRVEELFGRGVSTEKQRDEALAARDQARASVQLAKAEIASAKLNLDYTEVNSPATGVTSLQSQSIGTLIQAQQTLLTTITPLDPAYVSFSFTDEEGQAFREMNANRATQIEAKDLTVNLRYGNGSVYPHGGKVDTAAQRVDPQTGTIQARAVFPNPDGRLLPGQFVRVRIRGLTLPGAIVIPKQAVSQGPQGPWVYVVGQNDVAETRPIRLGPEVGPSVVVQEGLKDGERVVTDGIIRVRPGTPVHPQLLPAKPEAHTPTARTPLGARPQ